MCLSPYPSYRPANYRIPMSALPYQYRKPMREMVEGDIFPPAEPKPFDRFTAHEAFRVAGLIDLYYKSQKAHDQFERLYREGSTAWQARSEAAANTDMMRGEFFVAVCEWARKIGAKI